MNVFERLGSGDFVGFGSACIKTVDMHTSESGEPTRIVIQGYPSLRGETLLEKRRYAAEHHDGIRKRIMLEPRGHEGMYGAILVQETELTKAGLADIGVLFCHNEGYCTMCGHATIALGRFLVDTHDTTLFPNREQLEHDDNTKTVLLRLHAPCGVVRVRIPVPADGKGADGSRRVTFDSVPSFVTALDWMVDIPKEKVWPALERLGRTKVSVDIAYGGAFYAVVTAAQLGFVKGLEGIGSEYTIKDFDEATQTLKSILAETKTLFTHPREPDLQFLYGITVVDNESLPGNFQAGDMGEISVSGGETGLCFFAGQQIDRSPTGSCVCARVALAMKRGKVKLGETWNYESLVSLRYPGHSFLGTAVRRDEDKVIVRVEGKAFYVGTSTFVDEENDSMSDGFSL